LQVLWLSPRCRIFFVIDDDPLWPERVPLELKEEEKEEEPLYVLLTVRPYIIL
jgi:hypothetical protein